MKTIRVHLATDLTARAAICALFTLLTFNLLRDFLRTGHVTGLLLLAGEFIVVLLTILRRRAHLVDRSSRAKLMTVVSVAGPWLLRASGDAGIAPDAVTAAVSALGLLVVLAGKLTLGRSFGLVPANRGVVVAGPYTLVRHPIYSGYLITHAAFLFAHPTLWNISVIAIADVALVLRALAEERLLEGDMTYRSYCERVNWHLVPGVF